MVLLGLPLALPLAVLSFFVGFIPYIGSVRHDRPRVPRHGRRRHDPGHRDHGRVHDRLQHRPGQRRRAARLRQGRQPPPGDRAHGDPGRAQRSPGSSGCSSSSRSSASSPPPGGRCCACSASDPATRRPTGRSPPLRHSRHGGRRPPRPSRADRRISPRPDDVAAGPVALDAHREDGPIGRPGGVPEEGARSRAHPDDTEVVAQRCPPDRHARTCRPRSSPAARWRRSRSPRSWATRRSPGCRSITGLYTILLPVLLFALFGSSRHLVVGADSASAAIMATGLLGAGPRRGLAPSTWSWRR